MAENRTIKYVNREFNDFRNSLIELAQNYFPDTYNDFSPSSPGMMFIEMAAYVGDVLSFYQDSQLQETFLTHAKDPKNLYNLAYMMGYTPKVTGVAEVEVEITQNVNAVDVGGDYRPDYSTAGFINPNTVLTSANNQTKFLIDKAVDFKFSSSFDPTTVLVAEYGTGNTVSTFNIVKKAKAYSGESLSKTFNIQSGVKFNTLTLSDDNIVKIQSVVDGDGNTWTEVPFLGQDTVFLDETNSSSDSDKAPFVLAVKKVPRRFVSRFQSNGDLQIQFGAGTLSDDDSIILPDATNIGNITNSLSANYNGTGSLTTAYDPSNFTYSKSYGLAPSSDITVTYLKGGGIQANVPANSLTTATFTGTNTSNITFNNLLPAEGGKDGDTIEELRENSLRSFNAQNRAVTLQDYTVRALSLPSRYGSVAKVFINQDQLTNSNTTDSIIDNNPLALSLYVLAYDANKNLINASPTIKNNLKTYLSEFMLITDSINIKNAFVVNIELDYEITVRPNYSSREVLLKVTNELKEYFEIEKRNINQPINLSAVSSLIDKVEGVETVNKVEVINLNSTSNGTEYSEYGYDVKGATRNNVVYPSYDPCIFEIKFPDTNIKGRVVN